MVKSRWSIRWLVACMIIGPMVALAVALLTLGTATSRRIAADLGDAVLSDAANQVASQLDAYLRTSVEVSERYMRRIESGQLSTGADLSKWERLMLDDLLTTPEVASICFANEAGDSTWLLRHGDRLELGRAVGARGCAAVEYESSTDGVLKPTPLREYVYDARQRPWYKVATGKTGGVWTPIYFWFGEGGKDTDTGTGYTRAVRDAEGKLLGVLVIDTTLNSISQFLRRLPVAEQGDVFIIDNEELLVAATHGGIIGEDGKRKSIKHATHPAAKGAIKLLEVEPVANHSGQKKIFANGDSSRAHMIELRPFEGIHWHAAIVLPHSAFMTRAILAERQAIIVAIALISAGLALGLYVARSMTRPLLQISEHVQRVGVGDFESRLDLSAARELAALSNDLNKMAGDLAHHMTLRNSLALATQVQQSLLPRAAPGNQYLDIFGIARYCDSTGGDYYDYLEFNSQRDGSVLAVVGDVMGHGIAAALLMATTRAALRARALNTHSLADLMNTANAVLTRDNRHGRFMTLLLLRVEPAQKRIRFASAGHDPAIVFEPASGCYDDLDGGDVPLGVSDDVRYEEYTFDQLRRGQIILMGTDGIWEARNAAGEVFGKPAMCDVIVRHAQESAEQIGKALLAAIAEHTSGRATQDDITFVILKVRDVGGDAQGPVPEV